MTPDARHGTSCQGPCPLPTHSPLPSSTSVNGLMASVWLYLGSAKRWLRLLVGWTLASIGPRDPPALTSYTAQHRFGRRSLCIAVVDVLFDCRNLCLLYHRSSQTSVALRPMAHSFSRLAERNKRRLPSSSRRLAGRLLKIPCLHRDWLRQPLTTS